MEKHPNVHIIGICGKGMSGVAKLLVDQGSRVTGSDSGFYDPIASYLQRIGIEFAPKHDPSNIPPDTDYIVIGKHAKLVPESNPEVAHAFSLGIPIKSFPEVIHDLVQDTHNIVVVGSYGKSTTTALVAYALIHAGKDPGYFIGAVPLDFETSSHMGTGNYFVLEGDEYPSSNWDARSKFMHYRASSILLTSGEHDHINVFPTIEDYHKPFQELLAQQPKDGLLMYCSDNPYTAELAAFSDARHVSYSLNQEAAAWYAKNIVYGAITTFEIWNGNVLVGSFETTLLGDYNIQNIVGGVALLRELDALSVSELQAAVADFHGVGGRLERKAIATKLPVYESFGSSYTKAKTGVEAIRRHYPDRSIIMVFEPHTFSWRNREALEWYSDVFDGCDTILLYKPPGHGSDTHDQLSLDDIYTKVSESYPNARVYKIHEPEEALSLLPSLVQENSLILMTTSGSFDGLVEAIPKLFA